MGSVKKLAPASFAAPREGMISALKLGPELLGGDVLLTAVLLERRQSVARSARSLTTAFWQKVLTLFIRLGVRRANHAACEIFAECFATRAKYATVVLIHLMHRRSVRYQQLPLSWQLNRTVQRNPFSVAGKPSLSTSVRQGHFPVSFRRT
jgi:hypothetical protein